MDRYTLARERRPPFKVDGWLRVPHGGRRGCRWGWATVLLFLVHLAASAAPARASEAGRGPQQGRATEEARREARERWHEGIEASSAGDYERARSAFQRAYALIPHPATLRNLGLMELETGRFVDAARHLAAYLASNSDSGDKPDVLAAIEEKLKSAERMVGRLVLRIAPIDAVVTVDGERVPSALRDDTWYVAPGSHFVEVHRNGIELVGKEVTVPVAEARVVAIDFASPLPASAPVVAGPSRRSDAGAAARQPGEPPAVESASWRGPRLWAVVGGSVLTAGSLASAVYGGVRVNTLEDEADALRAEARESLGDENPCGRDGVSDAGVCRKLKATTDDRDRAALIANVGWIGVGVFGAATAAACLFWPWGDGDVARGSIPTVRPWTQEGAHGAVLMGRF